MRFFWIAMIGICWLMESSVSMAALPTPLESVSGSVDKIFLVLKKKEMSLEEKRVAIRNLVNECFDFRTMSKQILGKHWQRATEEQRVEFIRLYTTLLQNTYLVLVEEYNDESVIYGKDEIRQEKFATVDSIVTSSARKIPVEYKCILGKDRWYIYDVVIEGVSMVSNYRNSFAGLIRQKGFDGLLQDLKIKVSVPIASTSMLGKPVDQTQKDDVH